MFSPTLVDPAETETTESVAPDSTASQNQPLKNDTSGKFVSYAGRFLKITKSPKVAFRLPIAAAPAPGGATLKTKVSNINQQKVAVTSSVAAPEYSTPVGKSPLIPVRLSPLYSSPIGVQSIVAAITLGSPIQSLGLKTEHNFDDITLKSLFADEVRQVCIARERVIGELMHMLSEYNLSRCQRSQSSGNSYRSFSTIADKSSPLELVKVKRRRAVIARYKVQYASQRIIFRYRN